MNLNPTLPYSVSLRPVDFGAFDLPTLHSFAMGEHDGKWLLIAGRTNGLHGFDRNNPLDNFPPQFQNRDVWVIDPVARQTWRRSLGDASAGLTEAQILSLSPTNNQFYQSGERLYMNGGYGVQDDGGFGTFDTLTAIDLPGMIDWVQGGAGAAADHLRQLHDSTVRVTGGAMYEIHGRTHLVFGQDFDGPYLPNSNGAYTHQVRSFTIVDDGATLAIESATATTPLPEYRRRDMNIFPVMRPSEGDEPVMGLLALSGVFTPGFGAWTVPVEIDADGNPTMADPTDPATFKQSMNGYHSAKFGLFSAQTGEMHELLFGGISLQFYDAASDSIKTDNQLPFVNDLTAIVIDADGQYTQNRLGDFPAMFDLNGQRLRFGANAEFLLAEGVATFDNDVIQLDSLPFGESTVGYIFGGIVANGPHTRNVPGVTSAASNIMWEVVIQRVPEPGSLALAAMCGVAIGLVAMRRRLSR